MWENLEGNMIYDRAEAYYAKGQYPQALIEFRNFLDRYEDNYRANDAIYRTAQCLEALGERVDAANVYRAVALTYNRSSLAPAALLRSGELNEIEGFLYDAEWDYNQAATKYRETDSGRLAAVRLQAVRARIAEAERQIAAEKEAALRQRMAVRTDTAAAVRLNERRPWPPDGRSIEEVMRGQ